MFFPLPLAMPQPELAGVLYSAAITWEADTALPGPCVSRQHQQKLVQAATYAFYCSVNCLWVLLLGTVPLLCPCCCFSLLLL